MMGCIANELSKPSVTGQERQCPTCTKEKITACSYTTEQKDGGDSSSTLS